MEIKLWQIFRTCLKIVKKQWKKNSFKLKSESKYEQIFKNISQKFGDFFQNKWEYYDRTFHDKILFLILAKFDTTKKKAST